jgi:predicted nucleic acid-binding protein
MAISERKRPLRVMVDANVLIAGSAYPRWPHEVLRHALTGDFQLVLCPLIIEQARSYLRRRSGAGIERLESFLVLSHYEAVPDATADQIRDNKDLVRDVTDVPIALSAIQSHVDCLVSEDKDLSARDETTARLREMLCVRISGTFLREMMGWTSEELELVRGRSWDTQRHAEAWGTSKTKGTE